MGRNGRMVAAYLAAVGVTVAAAAAVLPPDVGRVLVPCVTALIAAVAVLVGVRRHRPTGARSWYLLAAGLVSVTVATALTGLADLGLYAVRHPSPSDAFTLLAYAFFLGGVLGLLDERVVGNRRAGLLDAMLGATACSMLAWTHLVRPTLELTDATLGIVLTATAYAVASIVLLAVAVPLWPAVDKQVDVSARILVLGMLVLVATSVAYGFAALANLLTPTPGVQTSIVAGWVAYFVLLGLAALHPSVATPPRRSSEDVGPPSWKRFGLLIVLAGLTPLAIVVGDAAQDRGPDLPVLLVGVTVMVAVTVVRMADIQSDLLGALRRERTLRTANDDLVAAVDVAQVRDVLVRATRALMPPTSGRVWLVEDPRVAGFEPAEDWTGPVDAVTGPSNLHGTLSADDDLLLVVAELPTSTPTQLAVVVAAANRPRREVLITFEALVHCAALAIDRVELGQQVLARQSELRIQRLLQDASDVVVVLDRRLIVRYVTPAVEQMLGRHPRDFTASRWLESVHDDDRDAAEAMIRGSSEGWPSRGEVRLVSREGATRYVEVAVSRVAESDGGGFTMACHDITVRHDLEEQLTHQAFHDALTGLANRALFQNRLRHAIDRSRRTGDRFALLFIDVDDFKTVNDSLGHGAGDALLRAVAGRLQETLRAQDTSARLGGDEFAVIIEDLDDPRGLDEPLQRLIEHLAQPVRIGAADVPVGVSVGVAYGGTGTDDPDELMRNADLALYEAKGNGKGCHAVFEPAMHTSAVEHLQLKSDLRRGLNQDELHVEFQPVHRLDEARTVVGVEALVRWQHPTRGKLTPDQFVHLAEQTGLIVPLGRRVLEQALHAAAGWHARPGCERVDVAVNVSARQLADPDLVGDVRAALERSGVDPTTVVLEITESTLLPDQGVTTHRLHELVALGVRLYVDDFGTGHSSLAHLRDLPVSGIKLAREFVDLLPGTASQAALVRTIHDLAGTLGLDEIVAEGIGSEEQVRTLVDLGYTLGQGDHLARPTDAVGIGVLLDAQAALALPGRVPA